MLELMGMDVWVGYAYFFFWYYLLSIWRRRQIERWNAEGNFLKQR